MSKKVQLVQLVSSAGTGCFYVKRKPINKKEKLSLRKFDYKIRQHVLFNEKKMPKSSK